jgi:small subunit ribosomal protein S20
LARSLSSQKRMRQNVKRRARNRARLSTLKTQVRRLTEALTSKDAATAEKEFRATVKALDRTATKRTIHRNTAARRKSRLARRVNALKTAAKP